MGHAPEHERKTAGVSRTYRVTYQRASWETPSVAEASGQEARLAPTRYADAGAMPKPLNSETEVLRQLYQMKNPATGRGWRSVVFLPAPPRVSSKRCGCARVVKRRCHSRHGGSIAVSTTGV